MLTNEPYCKVLPGLLSKKGYTGRDMKSHNCTAHIVALFEIALTDHIWCIKQNPTHDFHFQHLRFSVIVSLQTIKWDSITKQSS